MFKDLIVFEMANSHQGDVKHGLAIIRAMGAIARKYNISATVKLQYRHYDTFIHPAYKGRTDVPHIPRFLSTRLTDDEFTELVHEIRLQGLYTMSTPFDEESVDLCLKQHLDYIKVASCSAKDWPLLECIASIGKPMIVSTGGLTIPEIDKLYNYLKGKKCKFALMHCCAIYPSPVQNLQLDILDTMRERYPDVPLGYSGHEDPANTMVPAMAVAKGAIILERHVALPTETIRINSYSMTPEQAATWVETIVTARKTCSFSGKKQITEEESKSLESLQRGVYAKSSIKQGAKLRRQDVFFAAPLQRGQLRSGEFKEGMQATKTYYGLDPITEIQEKYNKYDEELKYVYRVRAMLNEAGIVVSEENTLELSHHYGLERFDEWGCSIVNIINRSYCKKLIVVFPRQQHPVHYHKKKEETFRVLSGKLELTVNGKTRELLPGDMYTILPKEKHAFSSKQGAVVEEISTHHDREDSIYEDPSIACKTTLERKTIFPCWPE